MPKGTLIAILGAIISVAALAIWFYVSPTPGAGWILFVAFVGSLGLLDSIKNRSLGFGASLLVALAAAALWFLGRYLPHAGWVGFLAILAGLRAFTYLNGAVAKGTKSDKKKKS